MDSTDRTTTRDLPLERLVALALQELERLGYSSRSRSRYHTTWRRLIAFAQDNDLGDRYSEELAARFVDISRPRGGEHPAAGDNAQRHTVLAVNVLGDFNRDGRIAPFYTDMLKVVLPPAMKKPLRDYERHCKDRRHLRPRTLAGRIRQIGQFLHFLHSRDVRKLQEMQPADVAAYIDSRQHFRPRTVSWIVTCLRQFLSFLVMRGTLRVDLSRALPTVRVVRDAAIPAVWDPEVVVKLLTAVDRSSPRGKRDYAILLLTARLGLRAGDICALRLDDLDWDAATLEITQSKTGAPLRLPVSEELGEALIDYLRFGRPKTGRREVFVKHSAPFGPFVDGYLYDIMTRWRRAAGIELRGQRQQGLHSLRHTLATQLLRGETPIHVISAILGHASTATTLIYAKADTEALRGAALDPEEARHVE